jgi:Zn-dependent oligopeptidase
MALQDRMAELSQAFSNHVLDATDAFAHYATAEELAGVPADVVAAARAAAEAEGKEGHKLTLHFPSYFPVMQYAQNRALRETLYTAYVTRASELGPAERDNSAVMRELLTLRAEEARCWALPTMPRCRWRPRWPAPRPRCCTSCATWPSVPAPAPRRTWPTCAPSPPANWA